MHAGCLAWLECRGRLKPYKPCTLSIWQNEFGPTSDSIGPGILVWPALVLPVNHESGKFIIQKGQRVFFTAWEESITGALSNVHTLLEKEDVHLVLTSILRWG